MENKILSIIFSAIDEVNEVLIEDKKQPLAKQESEVLYGKNSSLDSLGLVNLISAIESGIEEQYGHYISIADEKAMSLSESPFKTVISLHDYIQNLIKGL